MKVNIHNQCSDFKLTDREYFINGTCWCEYPDREVDTDNIMRVGLIPFLSTSEGVLMYVLQRKDANFGNRSGPTCIRLFVAWKSEGYKRFFVFIHLIECSKKLTGVEPRWKSIIENVPINSVHILDLSKTHG
jgi:hypothetical protein